MSLIQRLFGGAAPRTPSSSGPASQLHSQSSSNPSQQQPASNATTRRELLRVVLRDTLHRQGIPPEWIGAELLTSTSRTGERTVHWRLLVKHWDLRILAHGVALQQALIKRVTSYDPLAATWLSGISWQFALEDESVCPPLPHPGSWTSPPETAPDQLPVAAAPAPAEGDVIEGPVRIADTAPPAPAQDGDGARADLDKLLAIRDADFRQHAENVAGSWIKTEPAKL